MKAAKIIIGATITTLLATTACGSDDSDEQDRIAELEGQVQSLQSESEVPANTSAGEAGAAGNEDARFATEEFNFGQHSVLRDQSTGAEVATVSILSIDGDYECAGDSAIAVEVQVNTIGEDESVKISEGDLAIIDEDGGITDAEGVEGCDEPSEMNARANSEVTSILTFGHEGSSGSVAINHADASAFWSFGDQGDWSAADETASQGDGGLYPEIGSFTNCEDADIAWGGLMNAELEGLEIDGQYLADLEDWMAGNACW